MVLLGYTILKVCDGCKDGLDTGHPLAQNGAENGAALAPFRANGAHPSARHRSKYIYTAVLQNLAKKIANRQMYMPKISHSFST